jgi:anti-sigma factor RsiW
MTCVMDKELGAYVLDALEPEEADAVSRHLTGCPACREEVRGLAGTAALLARVTLPDIEGSVDAEAKPNRIRPARRRRPAAVAAAAAVLTASASVSVVRVLGGDHGSSNPGLVKAVDPATHVQAAVTMTSRGSGTQLHLTLAGAYPSGSCSLVARAGDGRSDTAATWVADSHGAADVAGATPIPASRLRELDVVTDTGQMLVRINLPHHSK